MLLLSRKYKTRRVSVLLLSRKCKTRRVSVFHLRWKYKTERVSVFHLRWKCKTRRVWVSPCRGVLHTPHRYPIRGKRKTFDDQMCKMIFGLKGRLWGVCNTPLPEKINTRRVWVSPCRGVLHTPHIYPIRGKRKAFDDQMCKMIFGPKGRLWGICNTPLLGKMKTQNVSVLLLSRKYKTRRVSVL